MVKRVIGGHWDRAPKLGDLALANKIEAYNLPQGVISHMYRDIAAHNIGTITTVGLYTFADPRNGGGKLNDCTKEDLVKVINIEGKELLLYKGFPINVVFLRASYADEYGNCTVHREIGPIDVTAMAQALQELRRKGHRPGGEDRPGRLSGSETGCNSRYLCGLHCGRLY